MEWLYFMAGWSTGIVTTGMVLLILAYLHRERRPS